MSHLTIDGKTRVYKSSTQMRRKGKREGKFAWEEHTERELQGRNIQWIRCGSYQYFLTTQCILPNFCEYCPLCMKPACCVDSLMMPSQHMLCTSLMRFDSPQVMNFTITSSHHMSTPHPWSDGSDSHPLLQFLTQPSLKWACLQCGSHDILKDSWRYGVVSLQLY